MTLAQVEAMAVARGLSTRVAGAGLHVWGASYHATFEPFDGVVIVAVRFALEPEPVDERYYLDHADQLAPLFAELDARAAVPAGWRTVTA